MLHDHWHIADTTKVETGLLSRHPSKESWPKGMVTERNRLPKLSDSNPVTMKSHGNTAIDTTGCHKRRREVEILADNAVEDIIGFLVGIVGTAITESTELLLTDVILQQRGVMPLNKELIPAVLDGKLGTHAVPAKEVFQLIGKPSSHG